jgi:hypothetical protein
MPSSASCRDAHAVMPRPRGIQDRTASDAVVLAQFLGIADDARWPMTIAGLDAALQSKYEPHGGGGAGYRAI